MPPFSGPLQTSSDGRYFTDAAREPFFWLGDTQWELCRSLSLEDVRKVLEDRSQKGFSVLQVMLTGVGDGTGHNVAGEAPWLNDDPDSPNERYFSHVDAVLDMTREARMVVALGVYHQLHAPHLPVAKARKWARWVAERYGGMSHLVWAMYPRAEEAFVPVVRELATGLREADEGLHLITVHPDPSPASSSFLPSADVADWLGFHSIQTWAYTHLIVPMIRHDYQLRPTRPVVMAEGAYEEGEEYGFEVSPLWVRRQAYWTVLAGGHHSYGHNHLWRLRPGWREALNAPGARQVGIMRALLTALREWWTLTPDPALIAEEGDSRGMNLAARSAAGDWALVYLGAGGSIRVNPGRLRVQREWTATWLEPSTGQRTECETISRSGVPELAAPGDWEDALLLLEAL